MIRRGRRGKAGFSLLEVLLALAIFTIAIVGIIESVGTQIRAERFAEDHTRAVLLAQNLLEEVRLSGEFEEERRDGQFEDADKAFAWQCEIRESERSGLYNVTATISWTDGRAQKKYATQILIADREAPGLGQSMGGAQ